MKEKTDPVIFLAAFTLACCTVAFIFQPAREPPDLRQEVESLRDDLNQLTVILSELDEPVNEFHNVPKGQ